jgi:hypothetical protein
MDLFGSFSCFRARRRIAVESLSPHDTADVLRLHEKKYKNTFGVGNVLPGDGTLFVSSTKYSKAGSAWTSLLSSDAAKDPDNGEASPTKHFTFSDLVVDANDVTDATVRLLVLVRKSDGVTRK